MGKNTKNKKKMKGAEKTNLKTEKKMLMKQKKMLAKIGEADIEELLAKYKVDPTKKDTPAVEVDCPAPSPRVNFSVITHPTKDQLIFYGGEFYDGQKAEVFDDLFFYTIAKDSWSVLRCGEKPLPRCGHQMVATATDGGQLWLFGGEYSSPSQLQFHHYSDLWVFRLKSRHWERITASGGPSARSGHRMILLKKRLFVFGGFHDNNQSYKYFNDVHFFSLEDYKWSRVEVAGVAPPPPRSGCCMAATASGTILVWGGYSKASVKKDADRGTTHWDSHSLVPDKHDPKGLSWKWVSIKMGGMRPPPRSGVSFVVAPNGRLYTFGGVMDTEEDEESIKSQFTSELHSFDPENRVWRRIDVTSGKSDKEMQDKVVTTVGAFTVTSSSSSQALEEPESGPSPRSHCGMAVCKGTLFLFGGTFEEANRDVTLGDFYSLDLQKPTAWRTIIENKSNQMEWAGSESDSNSENESSGDQESSDESDEDSDSDMDVN
ncbi:kelch domain-containing protein 4 [Phlebotomus argentipes]|uniref:kelch domain-containing protein 4 n=1 Tax=Phlebotomus argentipes TaxID=94469 RepID=UPI00289331BC|nr:kelch domain-containing protein 4 [Phlebotomus argentipes]